MNLTDPSVSARLKSYFELIGAELGNDERRASFATYAMGILAEGDRKSVEPIAARACADPDLTSAQHQRLLHFLANSKWDDHAVRLAATRVGLSALTEHEKVEVWIVDDTGFLKQGTHSVGVQRQYTGSAGKVTNCQVGTSLVVATHSGQIPIDFQLYLPKSWADDPARRQEAKIPDAVQFATKPELALTMIERAIADGVPQGVVLADSAYGSSSQFRQRLRELGLDYAVGVNPTTKVQLLGDDGKPRGKEQSLKQLARRLKRQGAFRRCTWRQGTRRKLTALFLRCQIKLPDGETATLLVEWRDGERTPANYFFVWMPKTMPCIKSTNKLVRIVMQRWRIERTYEDMKGELGLDHYEGRRYPGWHHHVSAVLCCYAFVVAESARRFPPSAGGSVAAEENPSPPRAALPGQLHHCPACHRSYHRDLATPMPDLPSHPMPGVTQ